MKEQHKVEMKAIYNLPGEGLVVELSEDEAPSLLYTRQGLQYRIVERKKTGIDTQTEEQALAQMNSLLVPQLL